MSVFKAGVNARNRPAYLHGTKCSKSVIALILLEME